MTRQTPAMTQPVDCQPRRNPSTLLHWSRRRSTHVSNGGRRSGCQERLSEADNLPQTKKLTRRGRSAGELATIARVDGPNYSPVFRPTRPPIAAGLSNDQDRSCRRIDAIGQPWSGLTRRGGYRGRVTTLTSRTDHAFWEAASRLWLIAYNNCCLTGAI